VSAAGVASLAASALTTPVWAQAPLAPSPAVHERQAAGDKVAFDVASVRPNKSGGGRHSLNLGLPGGRVKGINVSLAGLMTAAYQISANRIFGAPAWFDSEQFDIEATSEGNSTVDQNRLRLQSLLADRFKLASHHETRKLPVYALVLSKPGKLGPQLHLNDEKCDPSPPAASPDFPASGGTTPSLNCGDTSGEATLSVVRYSGRKIAMSQFLATLTGSPTTPNVDRPIVDRTGLSGAIDFSIEFAPASRADGGASGSTAPPSLFTALQEQLGLKLESQTGPVDVLVIDHIEEPSEN
jgi:uncharacterized protein (TIGR03435 family)